MFFRDRPQEAAMLGREMNTFRPNFRIKDDANRLETQKCVLGADLFHELALIEDSEQKTDLALRLKILCLYLYTSALPKEQQFQDAQHLEKVAALIEGLKDQPLPEKIVASVHCYMVCLGDEKKIKN